MAGFGGYKESGFGREGGREGMLEYLVPSWQKKAKALPDPRAAAAPTPVRRAVDGGLDRTVKMYVGGKQARPDSGYSYPVAGKGGKHLAEVGSRQPQGHPQRRRSRAQGVRLERHDRPFARTGALFPGRKPGTARQANSPPGWWKPARRPPPQGREVEASSRRIMHYAAWADKYDGAVRAPAARMLSLALNEPWDVMGISCPDEAPLLAFVSLVCRLSRWATGSSSRRRRRSRSRPAISIRCSTRPTCPAAWSTSSPATATRWPTRWPSTTISRRSGISAAAKGTAMAERESAGNLKAVWANNGKARDWFDPVQGEGEEFLFRATRIKTIWTPFGVYRERFPHAGPGIHPRQTRRRRTFRRGDRRIRRRHHRRLGDRRADLGLRHGRVLQRLSARTKPWR
jgi:aldehyde dehydrogenase (NAD+)